MTGDRLGVFGGSFNPVHLGHLHIAQHSMEIFGLSQVFFVVASAPPHKPSQDLIPFVHRYAMVSLAACGFPGFLPSLAELEPPASPYSIDSLAKVARQSGACGKNLYFIAGGDSLLDVAGWHSGETLLTSCNFVFVMRPGVKTPDLGAVLPPAAVSRVIDCRGHDAARMRHLVGAGQASPECRIFLVDAGAPDVAASQIRRLASLGQSIEHLVPPAVHEYILKLHLYGER